MSTYRAHPSRSDRAAAIAAVAAVHALLAALVLSRQQAVPAAAEHVRTTLIDIALPPPPPPPEPDGRARGDPGAAGKKADPAPIVVPVPKVVIPAAPPLPAAPIAGRGSASTAGASSAGSGTGAGGTGSGSGGGGTGTGAIGSEAQLLSGGLTRADYRRLSAFDAPAGRARLALTVGADGRVASCSVANSSGEPRLDASLCAILQPRMRWAAARDTAGNPISVGLYYIANWDRR